MPEGVEVKIQIENLRKLENQSIESIQILSGRYTRHAHPKNYSQIKKQLPLKIISIHNKGKFIYLTLSNNWFILIRLGMTGKLIVHKNPAHKTKHDHILFITPKYTLFFNDLRNFGTIEFINDSQILTHKLDNLGFDPLQDNITPSQFLAHTGKFNPETKIGDLLLNQKFISGIGNYLRADILYCSHIHPETQIRKLNPELLKKLLKCIVKTMHESYQKQKRKDGYKFIIYKQLFSPKGNPVEKYKDKTGRTIWFVPEEQPII